MYSTGWSLIHFTHSDWLDVIYHWKYNQNFYNYSLYKLSTNVFSVVAHVYSHLVYFVCLIIVTAN